MDVNLPLAPLTAKPLQVLCLCARGGTRLLHQRCRKIPGVRLLIPCRKITCILSEVLSYRVRFCLLSDVFATRIVGCLEILVGFAAKSWKIVIVAEKRIKLMFTGDKVRQETDRKSLKIPYKTRQYRHDATEIGKDYNYICDKSVDRTDTQL